MRSSQDMLWLKFGFDRHKSSSPLRWAWRPDADESMRAMRHSDDRADFTEARTSTGECAQGGG
jgi:hypothetical protein